MGPMTAMMTETTGRRRYDKSCIAESGATTNHKLQAGWWNPKDCIRDVFNGKNDNVDI